MPWVDGEPSDTSPLPGTLLPQFRCHITYLSLLWADLGSETEQSRHTPNYALYSRGACWHPDSWLLAQTSRLRPWDNSSSYVPWRILSVRQWSRTPWIPSKKHQLGFWVCLHLRYYSLCPRLPCLRPSKCLPYLDTAEWPGRALPAVGNPGLSVSQNKLSAPLLQPL